MTPEQLLNDPKYRKVLAAGGIGAAMLLALIMKKRAAAKGSTGATLVSAVPPANPPVDTNADALGQALAGLSQATNLLTTTAAGGLVAGSGSPVPGSGGAPGTGRPGSGPAYQPFSDAITKTNAPPAALDPVTRA